MNIIIIIITITMLILS